MKTMRFNNKNNKQTMKTMIFNNGNNLEATMKTINKQ